ncbi:hypothetical protein [Collinsella aerofaciens]|uniref:VgrG-related protein n=1 Tax=Collinsella aerofaciens TaxID=74426 RepID=UPI003DA37123
MQPKHSAIVAGLTLALSFGAVSAPAPAAAEEPTPGVASDATDIDKGLYTQQSFSGVLRSVQGVSFVNVTPEMKYFTKYESHGNYNQGFSYGDGYNALGYYQFDRRWSLIPFMKQVYNYSPEKYSMLKDAIDRGSEISNTSNAMYENGQLTELGRIAQEAFQGAYNTDPVEFSALQDAYAYNSYYAVTEAWLKSGLGIDISGRADCVKGMVWSITNMCGTGGCRDFFRWANLSNDMSDREFVTALSYSVVNNVATKYSSQPQYHEGWKNRYRNELKDCLVYIAEDEAAAAATPVQPEPTPAPSPTPDSNDGSSDDVNDDRMDAPSTDADGNGSAGGATNDGSTSNGSAAGDSSSSSAGNTDSDASGSTDAGTSNSSTGSSDSSVDTGSNNGSGSDATPDPDAFKNDSNKAPDAPVASPDKKPSFSVQLGSTLGSSLMAGVNNGSTQNKDNSDQASTEKTEAVKGDSKDKASEKVESDKGSSSDEKDDKFAQKKDEDKTEGEKKQSEDDDKSGADNQVQEQNDSKTVTTTTTTTTTTKSSGGNMPKTGDLIVMASLASASLATLGATSIVSGKHKLDQQKKASGEDDSEE